MQRYAIMKIKVNIHMHIGITKQIIRYKYIYTTIQRDVLA